MSAKDDFITAASTLFVSALFLADMLYLNPENYQGILSSIATPLAVVGIGLGCKLLVDGYKKLKPK